MTEERMRADLHIHTYYSDGGQSPADVIAAAKSRGVSLISVTDHDNCNARKEVKELAGKAGITAVDGEEFSSYDGRVKVHILGYGMDCTHPALVAFNKRLYDGAEERGFDILRNLAKAGINISYGEVVRERRCKKSPLHSVHIAIAGARKGYARSPYAFYDKYLSYGSVGFSLVRRPAPEETVKVIVESGGFASLAHPARISMDKDGVIGLLKRLTDCGLGGIEAVYSGHTAMDTQYYKELAERFGVLVTGGSDTHHSEGNRCVGVPEFYPDAKLLSALKLI